jgi:hypothetical protein
VASLADGMAGRLVWTAVITFRPVRTAVIHALVHKHTHASTGTHSHFLAYSAL